MATFEISVHAFDYDTVGGDDDLGVTSYTYRGNIPTVQTVTTTPGNKHLRLHDLTYTFIALQFRGLFFT